MHRLRSVMAGFLACAALPAASTAMETLPTGRDDSVLGAFQARCLREEPDYTRLEKQAASLEMTNLGDHSATGPDGGKIEGHRWGGKLPDGPFALYLSHVTTKAAIETSCGVSGAVPDADHFRDRLVRFMGLPPLPEPTYEPTGSAIYTWPNTPLLDHRVILQTKIGKDGKGFVLVTIAVKRAP